MKKYVKADMSDYDGLPALVEEEKDAVANLLSVIKSLNKAVTHYYNNISAGAEDENLLDLALLAGPDGMDQHIRDIEQMSDLLYKYTLNISDRGSFKV